MSKLGEIVVINGKRYQVVEATFLCEGCDLAYDPDTGLELEECYIEENDEHTCWPEGVSVIDAMFKGYIFKEVK